MLTNTQATADLLALLQTKSVAYGDFLLSSGARSNYYIDCRLTTLDAAGACLVGQVMHGLIAEKAAALGVRPDAVGGLTLGADPISFAVGMYSVWSQQAQIWKPFVVRKAAKAHGQAKRIEGGFRAGDTVVVVDDVITRGDATINAIEAIVAEGGKIAFVAVLVDRQEGGRQRIEALGYPVVAAFCRDQLIRPEALAARPA